MPQEVVQAGISTQKVQNSIIMFVACQVMIAKEYDELFLENYIKINLIPQVQRVPGVGQALVFGAKDYSMRIWLKPDDERFADPSRASSTAPGSIPRSGRRSTGSIGAPGAARRDGGWAAWPPAGGRWHRS